jgi:2-polyprenyl-6-hydroxyphenyl methylase/3-demethylubiquinone-9 3-methyltransferase
MESFKGDQVNNDFYDLYGERWYTAQDDPVGLLRAESRTLTPWVLAEIRKRCPGKAVHVLDIGCGAGFLANELARHGLKVTGIDASKRSLDIARGHDDTGSVVYRSGDALDLEFPDQSFEVACAMDFLEHVEPPARVLSEAARVLIPGGLFFFNTFNRNLLSWLVVIRGVEWFVRNTPKNMHCLRFFTKPSELSRMCDDTGLRIEYVRGLVPVVWKLAFWKMIFTGRVTDDFAFRFSRFPITGYAGLAVRIGRACSGLTAKRSGLCK